MIYLLLFSVLTLSTFGMHNVYKIQLENKKKMILSLSIDSFLVENSLNIFFPK